MQRKHYWLLAFIFVLALGTRLYFAFQVPHFSSSEAYFNLRQIESIKGTGLPIYYDSLSFSGRTLVFPPLFNYLLAGLSFVFPLQFVVKFFPNLFASFAVILSFLIARKITHNTQVALFTAFIAGFVPAYFSSTVNNISPYSLVIPLMLLLIYAFMSLDKKPWVYTYIIATVVLALLHPSAILFVLAILVYLVLSRIEGLKVERAQLEVALFSTFFVLLALFIMFKKLFLFHGPYLIWQNLPKPILSLFFSDITILSAIYHIGTIPFVSGIYIIYKHLFKDKNPYVYLLLSFALSVGAILWLRLIQPIVGFMFFGIILVLLFSQFFKEFLVFFKQTRFSRYRDFIVFVYVAVFVFTSMLPSFASAHVLIQNSITPEDIQAMTWLRDNTPPESIVVGTIDEGDLITAVAQRKNIIDRNFLYITDAEQRYSDLERIYTTFSETDAVSLLNKYEADYLYFSPKATKKYNVSELQYISEPCFSPVYQDGIIIYALTCRMEALT